MKKNRDKSLRKQYIAQFYKGNKLAFTVVVLTAFLIGTLNLMTSWLLQQILDTISGVPGALELNVLAFMIGGLILLIFLFEIFDYFSKPRFMKKAMQQYKDYVFQKLIQKNLNSFHEETTATYISALSNDANSIEVNYLERQFELVTKTVMFVGAFAMMILYSPLLTLAAVLLTCFPVLASLVVGNRLEEAEVKVSDRNKNFTNTLKESICGFTVIKSFQAESSILELFRKSSSDLENTKCKKRKLNIIIGTIGAAAGVLAQLGVFIVGAYLALSGKGITPGVVLVFVNLMNFVIGPISTMPDLLANRKASLALIDKLANALEANVREEGKDIPKKTRAEITIKDLSFGYKEEEDILHDIDLKFESGKSYALVGASGSGKSTILNLLLGAYGNYKGNILYGGYELRDISSDSLYEAISVIQQNVVIFNASVRDNITMFQKTPKEEVDRVIELSGLSDFIKEHGEDYLCGENGSALSGGEKQRISIARSLLRNAKVLLVDEATAALDKQTATQVSNAILDMDEMTRIVVTHSLEEALLKRYDDIVVLKDGCVVENGSYDALMERKGYFYSLYTVSQ